MKVLFFTTYVSQESGASHALRETVRRVASCGVKPLVVVPDCAGSREMFSPSEFETVYLPIERPRRTWNPVLHVRFAFSLPSTVLALRRLIRRRRIQLVHFNEVTDFLAGAAAKACGIPSVCHVRADGIPSQYRRPLVWLLKQLTSAIVVPSLSTKEWLEADEPDLGKRIRLIYDYAFDIREYEGPVGGAACRNEWGFSPDEIVVLQVSKLVTPKGHECLIRAAAKVLASSKGIRFVIVGGDVPGHEKEAATIRALALETAPEPGLRIVAPRKDLPSVYAASDIAVHCPIFPDTYPTVVLLAMLAGKPIIGSAIGGIPEQIDEGKNGVLVPADDPGALAHAILELARDPERREQLGAAGRMKITNEFSPQAQGQLLTGLYAEVLNTPMLKKIDEHAAGSAETVSKQETV
jgi:glycosyltransferase involved in cell wall biosynthesis